ncbi:hypothetical protein C4585_02170 [Candidatus Parcubacteria bacterium]|nr:MAG: hypothetical protein C4585_02170 [Candidatus Parcubacteria bacterium]
MDPVIIVEKDVRIAKATATSTTVDYTVVVTNQKNAQPAYYAILTDILYDPAGKVVYSRAWNLGHFERGDQVRLTYSVEFAATSTKPGIYKNLARVTGQRNFTTVKDQIIKMPTAEVWGEVEFGYVQVAAPAGAATVAGAACTALLTTNLGLRLRNDPQEVLKLQQFLNSDPDTVIASSGPGSPGNETTRFGSLTAAAVKKFQLKYASEILYPLGLTQPTGNVYGSTRDKINALACGSPALLNSIPSTTPATTEETAAAAKPAKKPAAKKAPAKTETSGIGSLGNLFKGLSPLFSW